MPFFCYIWWLPSCMKQAVINKRAPTILTIICILQFLLLVIVISAGEINLISHWKYKVVVLQLRRQKLLSYRPLVKRATQGIRCEMFFCFVLWQTLNTKFSFGKHFIHYFALLQSSTCRWRWPFLGGAEKLRSLMLTSPRYISFPKLYVFEGFFYVRASLPESTINMANIPESTIK